MLFAMLEVADFVIIALLILLLGGIGSGAVMARLIPFLDRIVRIEEKLDLMLTHAGLDYKTLTKTSWQALAEQGPARKIAAIKAYRDETGAGLADAKRAVEEYIEGRR
jgi:ribosomal protein L7/L12